MCACVCVCAARVRLTDIVRTSCVDPFLPFVVTTHWVQHCCGSQIPLVAFRRTRVFCDRTEKYSVFSGGDGTHDLYFSETSASLAVSVVS